MVPCCLTIAGSDSGGGAGIQADLKAFSHLGCHGMSAVVALTAQNTVNVMEIMEVPPSFIEAQLKAIFSDIGVDVVKTGMLFSPEIVVTVGSFLEKNPTPLVIDPVLIASSGAQLMQDAAATVLIEHLFPLATVVTPNLAEACFLAGTPYDDDINRGELAEEIYNLGPASVVVTGGHGKEPIDWFYDGKEHMKIPLKRLSTQATHGAGCTHSAAFAAFLAHGFSIKEAACRSTEVAVSAVRNGFTDLGKGEGPVDVMNVATRRPR